MAALTAILLSVVALARIPTDILPPMIMPFDPTSMSARYAAKIAEAELVFAAGRIRPSRDATPDDSSAESIN